MDIVVTGLVGFGGVLIGGALTGLAELWRQLLEGRAAARIIRMELQENMNRAVQSVSAVRPDIRLRDDGWRDLRVKLAPLLPQEVLQHLATGYGAIFVVEDWISKVREKHAEARVQIRQWVDEMMLDSTFLLQVERRPRVAQMLDLLLSRPTFPTPKLGDPAIDDELAKRKKKLYEMFEGTEQ